MSRGPWTPSRVRPPAIPVHDDSDMDSGLRGSRLRDVGLRVAHVTSVTHSSALPRGADERLHVIEITLECPATRRGKTILRLGHASFEGL